MTPQTVNAYYNAHKNEIVFPAAILQPPFFDAKADDALNYGGIGAVIGHEMGHGYDDQGSKFDAQGNNVQLVDRRRPRRVQRAHRQACLRSSTAMSLARQARQRQVDHGREHRRPGRPQRCLRCAADGAAKNNPAEAKKKIDGYTQEQRFFLNWARVWRGNIRPEAQMTLLNTDPHAPSQFRAIGAPSNMPAVRPGVPVQGRRHDGPLWR